MRAGQGRMVLLLSIGVAVLILAGVGSLGAYFFLRAQSQGARVTPQGSMRAWAPAEAIQERLAIQTLAGASELALIDRSMAEGHVDTALSLLAHSVTLTDRSRAGVCLRLAAAFAAQKRVDLAVALYRKVATVAVLSPDLADITRGDLLVDAAIGLVDRNQRKEAVELLDQASAFVRVSPDLKPAQRQGLAERVDGAYRRAGASNRAALDNAKPPADATFRVELQPAIALGASVPLAEAGGGSPSLANVEKARKGAAAELTQYQEAHPGERPEALVAGLKDTLLAEEAAFRDWQAEPGGPALQKAEAAVRWLSTQSQVAHQMLGLSLAPEWESAKEDIDRDVQIAWQSLFLARRETVMSTAMLEWQRTELEIRLLQGSLLAGEMGLIPGYQATDDIKRLQDALVLRQHQTPAPAWTLEVTDQASALRYVIRAP